MDDLIREVEGIRNDLQNLIANGDVAGATVATNMVWLCDAVITLARQVTPNHQHRLQPFNEQRTGEVIPKGY